MNYEERLKRAKEYCGHEIDLSKNYTETKSSKIGIIGESWFKTYISDLDNRLYAETTKDELSAYEDIDFYVIKKDDCKLAISCEIKADTRISSTRNMFIETYCNQFKYEFGWFLTTRAEVLVYCNVYDKEMYMFRISALRDYCYCNKEDIITRSRIDHTRYGDKKRVGGLVNIDNFADWCVENKRWFRVIDTDTKKYRDNLRDDEIRIARENGYDVAF